MREAQEKRHLPSGGISHNGYSSTDISAGFMFIRAGCINKEHGSSLGSRNEGNTAPVIPQHYLVSGSVLFHPVSWRAWPVHHETAPGARVDRIRYRLDIEFTVSRVRGVARIYPPPR